MERGAAVLLYEKSVNDFFGSTSIPTILASVAGQVLHPGSLVPAHVPCDMEGVVCDIKGHPYLGVCTITFSKWSIVMCIIVSLYEGVKVQGLQ